MEVAGYSERKLSVLEVVEDLVEARAIEVAEYISFSYMAIRQTSPDIIGRVFYIGEKGSTTYRSVDINIWRTYRTMHRNYTSSI